MLNRESIFSLFSEVLISKEMVVSSEEREELFEDFLEMESTFDFSKDTRSQIKEYAAEFLNKRNC